LDAYLLTRHQYAAHDDNGTGSQVGKPLRGCCN